MSPPKNKTNGLQNDLDRILSNTNLYWNCGRSCHCYALVLGPFADKQQNLIAMNRISEFYNLSNGERRADSQLTLDFLDALAKSGLRVKSKTRLIRRRAESWASLQNLPLVGTIISAKFGFDDMPQVAEIVKSNYSGIRAQLQNSSGCFLWRPYLCSDPNKWIKDFWKTIKVVSVP